MRIIKTTVRSKSVASLAMWIALVLVPLAAPFAVGTNTGANVGTAPTLVRAATSAATLGSPSIANVDTKKEGLWSRLTGPKQRRLPRDATWKHGEVNATISSRLLFGYASPLVDLATDHELDENDAFDLPPRQQMGSIVPELESIYQKCRSKRAATLSARQQRKNESPAKKKKKPDPSMSEASTLLRALFLHHRGLLLYTGVLRIINTAVQAFPPLLVARLLRLLESGHEKPVSAALRTAAMLVMVLSTKTIIENQYFFNVIKTNIGVRGSLAGIVFDKCLRLPADAEATTATIVPTSSKDKKQQQAGGNKSKSLGRGGVLNLMESDAGIVGGASMQIHTIWDGPLQVSYWGRSHHA